MTVNAFVSVSLDPPLVLVSLDHKSSMHPDPAGRREVRHQRADVEHQESLEQPLCGSPRWKGLHVHFVRHDGVQR